MKLGWLEKLYVNGVFRHRIQRPLEMRLLNHLVPMPTRAHVLDIGCGNGGGLLALGQRTHALSLTGVDIDESQLARARNVLAKAGLSAQLVATSAENIPLPANSFDVATSFGALHHIPNWQKAVGEINRMLRHGGLFYMLEFYAPLVENAVFRTLLPHPKHRFTHAQLLACLKTNGLTPLRERNFFGMAGIIVARHTGNPAGYD